MPKHDGVPTRPVTRMLAAARAGNAGAQYEVGAEYATGARVAQSWTSAVAWFTRSAAQVSAPIEVWAALGDCHRLGHGVPVSAEEAARLYRTGADAGDAEARYRLAKCFETGVGVPADMDVAVALYAAAANAHPPALYQLAACYARGRGVTRDVPRAVALFQRLLTLPPGNMTSDALRAAGRHLGVILWEGDGVPRDTARAAGYWRQAAALGDDIATSLLREYCLT